MKNKLEQQTEDLLLRQYDRYYRLAYSYTHSTPDALDIVQESAYRAIKHCHLVRNDAYLGTWIYRIVIHTSLEFLRKQKREMPMAQPEEPTEAAAISQEESEQMHRQWELQEELEHLTEKERTVLTLRYFEDCTLEEIAQITGENLNTVKARLYRSLKKLRLGMEQM